MLVPKILGSFRPVHHERASNIPFTTPYAIWSAKVDDGQFTTRHCTLTDRTAVNAAGLRLEGPASRRTPPFNSVIPDSRTISSFPATGPFLELF